MVVIPRLAIVLIVALADAGGLPGPLRVEVFRDGEPVAVVEHRTLDDGTTLLTNARRQPEIGTAAGDPDDPRLPIRLERSMVDATVHLLYAADASEPEVLVTHRAIRQLAAWTGSDLELTLDPVTAAGSTGTAAPAGIDEPTPAADAVPTGNRVLFMRRGSSVLVSVPAAGLFLVVSTEAGS